jgi:hypothetical protein
MFSFYSVPSVLSCRGMKNDYTQERNRIQEGDGVANSFRGSIYERGKWGGENSQSHKLDNNYLPSVCYFLFGFPVTECVTARNVERIFGMKYLLAPFRPKESSFHLTSIRGKLICYRDFN